MSIHPIKKFFNPCHSLSKPCDNLVLENENKITERIMVNDMKQKKEEIMSVGACVLSVVSIVIFLGEIVNWMMFV